MAPAGMVAAHLVPPLQLPAHSTLSPEVAPPDALLPLDPLDDVDADLLLVSQIGGLRAKSARAHVTASKLSAAIAECHDRREQEVKLKRDRRRQRAAALSCVLERASSWPPRSAALCAADATSAVTLAAACWQAWRGAAAEAARHRWEAGAVLSAWRRVGEQQRHARELQATLSSHASQLEDNIVSLRQRHREQVVAFQERLLAERRMRRVQRGGLLALSPDGEVDFATALCVVDMQALFLAAWRRLVATATRPDPSPASASRRRVGSGGSEGSPRRDETPWSPVRQPKPRGALDGPPRAPVPTPLDLAQDPGRVSGRRLRRRSAALADRIAGLIELRRRPDDVAGASCRECLLAWRVQAAGPAAQRRARGARVEAARASLALAAAIALRGAPPAEQLAQRAFAAWRAVLRGGLRAKVAGLLACGIGIGIAGPLLRWASRGEAIEACSHTLAAAQLCWSHWRAASTAAVSARELEAGAKVAEIAQDRAATLRGAWAAWMLRALEARCERRLDAEARAATQECREMHERLEGRRLEQDELRRRLSRVTDTMCALPRVGLRLAAAEVELVLAAVLHAWRVTMCRASTERRLALAVHQQRQSLVDVRVAWAEYSFRACVAGLCSAVLASWRLQIDASVRGSRCVALTLECWEAAGARLLLQWCWMLWCAAAAETRRLAAGFSLVDLERERLNAVTSEAQAARRQGACAVFATAFDCLIAQRAALVFAAWRGEACLARRSALGAEGDREHTRSARVAITALGQAHLGAAQRLLSVDRLFVAWSAWQCWRSIHLAKSRCEALELSVSAGQAEQEEKFTVTMEALAAGRVRMVSARERGEGHIRLVCAFVALRLHATVELASRRLHLREQGVVSLFEAERNWLGLQRERYAERRRAHFDAGEVRLAALDCLVAWRRCCEVRSLASARVKYCARWEGVLAWLWDRTEEGALLRGQALALQPSFVCLGAWRAYSARAAGAAAGTRRVQGKCDNLFVVLGAVWRKHAHDVSTTTCWEAWCLYRGNASADRRVRVLQARYEELDEVLKAERAERQMLAEEMNGRREGLMDALQSEADILRERHAQMRARSQEISRQLNATQRSGIGGDDNDLAAACGSAAIATSSAAAASSPAAAVSFGSMADSSLLHHMWEETCTDELEVAAVRSQTDRVSASCTQGGDAGDDLAWPWGDASMPLCGGVDSPHGYGGASFQLEGQPWGDIDFSQPLCNSSPTDASAAWLATSDLVRRRLSFAPDGVDCIGAEGFLVTSAALDGEDGRRRKRRVSFKLQAEEARTGDILRETEMPQLFQWPSPGPSDHGANVGVLAGARASAWEQAPADPLSLAEQDAGAHGGAHGGAYDAPRASPTVPPLVLPIRASLPEERAQRLSGGSGGVRLPPATSLGGPANAAFVDAFHAAAADAAGMAATMALLAPRAGLQAPAPEPRRRPCSGPYGLGSLSSAPPLPERQAEASAMLAAAAPAGAVALPSTDLPWPLPYGAYSREQAAAADGGGESANEPLPQARGLALEFSAP